ncbi:MAG: DUF3180 domain-containing protein [Candidatus Nanopelagicales bacterium]
MTATRPRTLLLLALLGAVGGWVATALVDAFAGRSFPVPLTVPALMLVLALSVFFWARGTRARLEKRPGAKPMPPLLALRTAALALAVSRAGALVGGFYLGVAVTLSPSWDIAYVRGLIVTALVTVVGSGLLVVAGLWLERICRIPPSDDDGADPAA